MWSSRAVAVFGVSMLVSFLLLLCVLIWYAPTAPEIVIRETQQEKVMSEPDYDQQDAELLARLLYAECRGEPRGGWWLVAQCVMDRLEDGRWGKTVKEVITAKGQFAKPGLVTNELLEVARATLCGEKVFPHYRILYFRRTSSKSDWHASYLRHVGNHAAYGYKREEADA